MNIGRETLSKDKLDAIIPPSPYHRIRNFIRKPEIAWPLSLFLVTRSFLALLGYELWLSGIVHTTSESHARLYSGILPVVNGAAGVLRGLLLHQLEVPGLRMAHELMPRTRAAMGRPLRFPRAGFFYLVLIAGWEGLRRGTFSKCTHRVP